MRSIFVVVIFYFTCNLNFVITQDIPDLDADLFGGIQSGEQKVISEHMG